jgi:hypothetical protein
MRIVLTVLRVTVLPNPNTSTFNRRCLKTVILRSEATKDLGRDSLK